MSRRTETAPKRTGDVLTDVLEGHVDANREGPEAARKYLERVLDHNRSLPLAVRFFLYDLLADACSRTGADERRDEALGLCRRHLDDARADTPRALEHYLPETRFCEVGIRAAVDDGRFEDALELCELAQELGLGVTYARKADSIRRMC